MKDDICAEMCVCLVRVESCPYKLCSVDLRFSAYLGFSFSVAASMAAVVLGCRITRSVLLVLTYLVSFGLFFFRFVFVLFRCFAVDHSTVTSSDI